MKNLVNSISSELKSQIKHFGVTEIIVSEGEVYITSNYTLLPSLIEEIESEALRINEEQKVTLEGELKRRFDLINNETFRSICASKLKEFGMTEKEWNDNRAVICLMMANEICRIENLEK